MPPRTLIAGIGSHHGDDQFGWLAAQAAANAWAQQSAKSHPSDAPDVEQSLNVQLAKSPADLLDWLAGADRLIVCDACCDDAPAATLRRFTWPAEAIESTKFSGSHDLDLATVLHLAAELNQLPEQTVIWTAAATRFGPNEPVSREIARAAAEAGRQIAEEIHAAARHSDPARTSSDTK